MLTQIGGVRARDHVNLTAPWWLAGRLPLLAERGRPLGSRSMTREAGQALWGGYGVAARLARGGDAHAEMGRSRVRV